MAANLRSTVEVAKRARELVEQLRKEGFDERAILMGLAIAAQAAPVTKAIDDNPHIGRIAKRLMPLLKEGVDLVGEIRQIAKMRGKHAS